MCDCYSDGFCLCTHLDIQVAPSQGPYKASGRILKSQPAGTDWAREARDWRGRRDVDRLSFQLVSLVPPASRDYPAGYRYGVTQEY